MCTVDVQDTSDVVTSVAVANYVGQQLAVLDSWPLDEYIF